MSAPRRDTDSYVLDRGYVASMRLNWQSHLWKNTLGFTLHPRVPKPHAESRIADLATGTGIWLLDLATELPETVKLDGYDISLSQCPWPFSHPLNVALRQWNIFDAVPEDLHGQYDIVHIRSIVAVIQDNNPLPVIENVAKLLKPGGFLQWEETSNKDAYVLWGSSWLKIDALTRLRDYICNPQEGMGNDDWIHDLPKTLRSHGFSAAQSFCYEDKFCDAKYWNDTYLHAIDEFTQRTLGGRSDALRNQEMIAEAYEEAKHGAAVVIPKMVCVARKSV